jgi:hypothetical protein
VCGRKLGQATTSEETLQPRLFYRPLLKRLNVPSRLPFIKTRPNPTTFMLILIGHCINSVCDSVSHVRYLCIYCGLLRDAANSCDYVASSGRTLVNSELGRMWIEAVVL